MVKDFKSDSDIWDIHQKAWNSLSAEGIYTSLCRAYAAAEQADDMISYCGLDGISKIWLNLSLSSIDDLEERRKSLINFCRHIHGDAEDLIDYEFNYGVMKCLSDIYALNPGDIKLCSSQSGNNLESMMASVIIDSTLRKGFLAKAGALDKDVLNDDLKDELISAIGRFYNNKLVDQMPSTSTADIKFINDMMLVIEYYEYLNPDDAKNMDRLLKQMYKDTSYNYKKDIMNIKYMAYTAKEPYQSIFFKYLPDMKIKDYNNTDTQYYNSFSNNLYVNFVGKDGKDDRRGPYVTFFHECGHAIDDLIVKDRLFSLKHYTSSFKYNNMTFLDAIHTDVKKLLLGVADKYVRRSNDYKGATEKEIESAKEDIVTIMMQAENDCSSLDNYEVTVFKQIKNALGFYMIEVDYQTSTAKKTFYKYKRQKGADLDFSGEENEAISDILSGMTNNKVSGSYGHRKAAEKLTDSDYYNQYAPGYDYWFNKKGKTTGKQAKETFAELFSYNMTGSSAQLKSVDEYLPETKEFFNEMIRGLADE